MLNVYKNIGETPLECLNRLRGQYPEYKDVPLSYAGRLDPMAEGVLLVLVGEENKKREKYLSLDKEYTTDILFGFATDTYDVLGLSKVSPDPVPISSKEIEDPRSRKAGSGRDRGSSIFSRKNRDKVSLPAQTGKVSENKIKEILEALTGKMIQKYPAYSSKPVEGKPLFEWARSETLHTIEIPSQEVEVYSIVLQNYRMISKKEFNKLIKEKINLVKGDFRQKEILQCWEKILDKSKTKNFPVAQINIKCSSGTYVRSLAHSLGETLGTGALTLSIKRIRVGQWDIKDSIRI